MGIAEDFEKSGLGRDNYEPKEELPLIEELDDLLKIALRNADRKWFASAKHSLKLALQTIEEMEKENEN
jgi:hypothetical protein